MTPIQQMLLGVGASKKTYMDDVFSTYLYTGNATARSINNGIDLSGEGGMTWIKGRSSGKDSKLSDTVRGVNSQLMSHSNSDVTTSTDVITSFNNNGFTIGTNGEINQSGVTHASWSFRKAPGFFTVCQWSGNATGGREISHDLGSVPGMILVKETTGTQQWYVYHRDTGPSKYLVLNGSGGAVSGTDFTNGVTPTSTAFTLSSDAAVNGSSKDYIAYVFAGGESTASTARSVDFTGGSLTIANSTDFDFGSGDFTIEFWAKKSGGSYPVVGKRTSGGAGNTNFIIYLWDNSDGKSYIKSYFSDGSSYVVSGTESTRGVVHNEWGHYAIVRNGNTFTYYVNGIPCGSTTSSAAIASNSRPLLIASDVVGAGSPNMNVSNLRIVKGTAVYTSAFRPSTVPLTNITNTKLLCCNNSSVTGASVTPSAITTNYQTPTASTDSGFDDPAGFVFGDSKEGIIKCGSYKGTGTGTGPEINLGFEPQFLIVKNSSSANSWFMFDTMRGIATGANDIESYANSDSAEVSTDRLSITPTGFKLKDNEAGGLNTSDTHIYMAIRRPDGYVGKPAEVGTDVFHMLASPAAGSPWYRPTDFAVDMSLSREVTGTHAWDMGARIIQGRRLQTDNSNAETSGTYNQYYYNNGWNSYTSSLSGHQSWMWKRHAGFDVVTYTAQGGTLASYSHQLGKIPEMMWVKRRDGTNPWSVYHKGLNGGSSPEGYGVQLNTTAAEAASSNRWGSTAPTSTHFFTGSNTGTNNADSTYIAMLFASVSGISKVGRYAGSSSNVTLDLGFSPRFMFIKRVSSGTDVWMVFDTVRGMGTGNVPHMHFDLTASSTTDRDWLDPVTDGVVINTGIGNECNSSGNDYIYYAHA